MPELPEVESVRRSLEPHLLHIKIAHIDICRKDFLTPKNAPIQNLLQQKITRTHRHGKKLFLIAGDSDAAQTLLVHLGMSGRVDVLPEDAPVEKHTHIIFTLANHIHIRLRDPRRFGGLWYYPSFEKARAAEIKNLGPDALFLTPDHLAHWKKGGAAGKLKARLLSQKDVAGLGNIYVDEALFLAKLHPLQRVSRLKPGEITTLVAAIHNVLNASLISGGTTLRDYRNVSDQPGDFARQLQAYGHAGLPCPRCNTLFHSATIATRTTVFCPNCQRRH